MLASPPAPWSLARDRGARLRAERCRACQLSVHRHEVVHASHRKPVARVMEHPSIGTGKRTFKLDDLAVHGALVDASPRITVKPSALRAAAMSSASFLGFVSSGSFR